MNSITSPTKTSVLYFEEIIKEIKLAYQNNDFNKISSQLLNELKYAYSILVLEFLKNTVSQSNNNGSENSNDNGKGVVIDVTDD